MFTATTPKHTFTLPLDTGECKTIRIVYKQAVKGCGKPVKLIKEYTNGTTAPGMTLDEDTVIIRLTQQETLLFNEGNVNVQVRVVTNGGDVIDSQIMSVSVVEAADNDILEV